MLMVGSAYVEQSTVVQRDVENSLREGPSPLNTAPSTSRPGLATEHLGIFELQGFSVALNPFMPLDSIKSSPTPFCSWALSVSQQVSPRSG